MLQTATRNDFAARPQQHVHSAARDSRQQPPPCRASNWSASSHVAVSGSQVQGDDNILDLVKLVQPAALIPLMNAEIESSGAL